MPARARTAVVAEPVKAERERLCAMLAALGFARVEAAEDGLSALRLTETLLPDALALSATLRPSDGVWLARAVSRKPLPVRPAIVLARVPGLALPGEAALRAEGAAVIDRPVRREDLAEALARTDVSVRALPERFVRRRDALLDRLGVSGHEGRAYLEAAISYAWLDMRLARALTTALYPMVGRRFGVSARKVERSMRYAIELAWKYGQIEEQYRIFRGTIDAQRGKPTCGEMISQLADMLRMEEVRE
ncbi:MAG TPA: hypothetical protein IAA75_00220 [Candidatus Pullichristensenella avicola]|nr:hypothetical protein [Candidatus Pullichristensenella avicola]